MREGLAQQRSYLTGQYQLFAASIVSSYDVGLLKAALHSDRSSNEAGDIALALFTRGGVGNLSTELRPWLESTSDQDSPVVEVAPLVMSSCVKALLDGTSLRCLFEFANQYDVSIELERLLNDLDDKEVSRLLRATRSEQITRLLDGAAINPTDRKLWLLRTYVSDDAVYRFLMQCAFDGRCSAVMSLMQRPTRLEWSLFDSVKIVDEFDVRCMINAALENLARGASRPGFEQLGFVRSLSGDQVQELRDGLPLIP